MSHSHQHPDPQSPQSTSLRDLQAPLKAQYRNDPSSALITLSSTGTLDGPSISCKLPSGTAASRIAGLHPLAGGPSAALSSQLCSGDMLLEALVACAGVTLKAVANSLSIPIRKGEVRAEGDLDFRGTLGVDREAKVGLADVRVFFEVDLGDEEMGDEEREGLDGKLETLLKLTERYCVVLQTIKGGTMVRSRIARSFG